MKDQSDPNSELWLQDRFKLFEQFCLPSVANQSVKDFIWLVFFDTGTPESFRQKITAIQESYSFFRPVYIDGAARFNEEIIAEVKSHCQEVHSHIITSRLDNDDALDKSYIECVQSQFTHQSYTYLECLRGCSLQVEPIVRLALIDKPWNPFASLIEENGPEITTISTKNHDHWASIEDKIELNSQALWLQVIHEKNVTNQFGHQGYLTSGGYLLSDIGMLRSRFAIHLQNVRQGTAISRYRYNLSLFIRHGVFRLKRVLKNLLGIKD